MVLLIAVVFASVFQVLVTPWPASTASCSFILPLPQNCGFSIHTYSVHKRVYRT